MLNSLPTALIMCIGICFTPRSVWKYSDLLQELSLIPIECLKLFAFNSSVIIVLEESIQVNNLTNPFLLQVLIGTRVHIGPISNSVHVDTASPTSFKFTQGVWGLGFGVWGLGFGVW